MKYCTACGISIAEGANFCPKCGEKQLEKEVSKPANVQETENVQPATATANTSPRNRKRFPTLFTLLLVIAFIGPLHIIAMTFFFLFFGFLFKSNPAYLTIASVWMVTSLTTFIGIILLLLKRKKGWMVYRVSQIAYILTAIIAMLALISESKAEGVEYTIIILFIIPAIILLGIFWKKKIQNYLN